MEIYPCETNYTELCGFCKPNNTSAENNPVPIERLSEYLAVLIHGCIFQSYFTNIELEICLRSNGNLDSGQWIYILNLHRKNSIPILNIEREYYEKIRYSKALEEFLTLKVDDYLLREIFHNHFVIDVEKLKRETVTMIENYAVYYKELIAQYRQQLNPSSL